LTTHNALRITLFTLYAFAASAPASAGTWGTQAVLANNAYNGTVALDAAGNMVSIWYQNALPNGTAVNEIWASTAAFGQPWSAPVNISGPIGVASGNPSVRGSSSGNVTAVYTSQTTGATYVDRPAGGNWGTPGTINGGVSQFYVHNDKGDEGLAWGTGGARASSSTVDAMVRPAGGAWGAATTIAAAPHLSFNGSVMAPDGTTAVAWESFDSVCGSRTCKTSNWVLHVSTLAPGAQTWVDSGALLGPDTTSHFAQMAADGNGNLGAVALQGGNLVSVVRHASGWTSPAVVAPLTAISYYTGTGRDNRVYASDANGHATVVSWGPGLYTLVAVDGNLATNTWGAVTTISGQDQNPNYFDFAMSSTGAAIVFWSVAGNGGYTTWRAATRGGSGMAWNAPATAGTSFEGGGTPEGVAVNSAGEAAVVFHGYSSDYLTFIQYTNTYHP
jgi:hypothetical protein